MTPSNDTLALPFLKRLGIVCSVPTSQELDALQREVNAIKWWHAIDLGNGIVTPGPDPTPARVSELQIPRDLTGLSVLDVGAWDGFFSFEAERRGASRVLATDSFAGGREAGAPRDSSWVGALNSRVRISPSTCSTSHPEQAGHV
jgi:hypothetical protein